MLIIKIEGQEFFNEETEQFESNGDFILNFEHSLVSLSKWESEFEKPFLDEKPKTTEELLSYIKYMILNEYDDDILNNLNDKHFKQINSYIEAKKSATTFGITPKKIGRSETITSELIYFWMVTFNIPFECETWHLNRLFSLIRICNLKNSKPTKSSKNEIYSRNRELNAQRKAELNSTG